MENYIVRIYRRDSANPEQVNGMLESVEQDTRRPFANLNTLNSMLADNPEAIPDKSTPAGKNSHPGLSLAK